MVCWQLELLSVHAVKTKQGKKTVTGRLFKSCPISAGLPPPPCLPLSPSPPHCCHPPSSSFSLPPNKTDAFRECASCLLSSSHNWDYSGIIRPILAAPFFFPFFFFLRVIYWCPRADVESSIFEVENNFRFTSAGFFFFFLASAFLIYSICHGGFYYGALGCSPPAKQRLHTDSWGAAASPFISGFFILIFLTRRWETEAHRGCCLGGLIVLVPLAAAHAKTFYYFIPP